MKITKNITAYIHYLRKRYRNTYENIKLQKVTDQNHVKPNKITDNYHLVIKMFYSANYQTQHNILIY